MKNITVISIFSIMIFLAACAQWSSRDIVGTWEAVTVTEEGQPLEVDYPTIRLSLKPDGTYDYKGTLNYREAGQWRIKANYLYTTDTLKENSVEKAVFISTFTIDSLELQMTENEKPRIMTMIKLPEN